MADFPMDSDITAYNSLEIALYRNGPLAKASSADIITERMSHIIQRMAMRKCEISGLC